MINGLVKSFEIVQAIPYRCRVVCPKNLDISLPYANCSQKRDLLKKSLDAAGFKTRRLDAIFDWRDLPLPKEVLKILKKSGTLQKHHLLEILSGGTYIKVDPTWNLELGLRGFPVTRKWDGERDTEQITKGGVLFYNPRIQEISLPYYPKERERFAEEFNAWLGW